MSEVITFGRHFSAWHPKAGQPTYFVEKILRSLPDWDKIIRDHSLSEIVDDNVLRSAEPKYHTIRSGARFEAGDKFSPCVWSGEPNQSKQILIAPDMEVKKTWSFDCDENGLIRINGFYTNEQTNEALAKNDGLSLEDFSEWLVMPCIRSRKLFKGQVICWSDSVFY